MSVALPASQVRSLCWSQRENGVAMGRSASHRSTKPSKLKWRRTPLRDGRPGMVCGVLVMVPPSPFMCALEPYNLRNGIAEKITCPVFIAVQSRIKFFLFSLSC